MRLAETLRAAFVIGRRDFVATVFSKSFLFFLLGPLFPLLLGATFGGIGAQVALNKAPPIVAVIASEAAFAPLAEARTRLEPLAGDAGLVPLARSEPQADRAAQRERLLGLTRPPVLGVLDLGDPLAPRFTGAVRADGRVVRQLEVMLDTARRPAPTGAAPARLEVTLIAQSAGRTVANRELTSRAGQTMLFLLTVLLAGMLLSQLIEEKSNKVIEVLAAAVPIDSIFIGKLFAMLAMSLVGIAVWTAAGTLAFALLGGGLSDLTAPAVGWPAFFVLGGLYFAMSYLLIGAAFLGIGAQASTVREVQTLSMPVTMAQVLLFGLASAAVGKAGEPYALATAIFPLSSPFTMIARAAELEGLWPHLVALAWQALWVALILRFAARMFRRSVLKSGAPRRWRWRWPRLTPRER